MEQFFSFCSEVIDIIEQNVAIFSQMDILKPLELQNPKKFTAFQNIISEKKLMKGISILLVCV